MVDQVHTGESSTQQRFVGDDDDAFRYVISEAVQDDVYTIVDEDSVRPEEANGAEGRVAIGETSKGPGQRSFHEQMHHAPAQDPFPSPDFPGTMLEETEYDADADDMVETNFPWPTTPMTPPYTTRNNVPSYVKAVTTVPPADVDPVLPRFSGQIS